MLDLLQRLISTVGRYEHHLCLIVRETGYINHPVKVNLIDKRLYLFIIPIVPCRLIYLNNFLRYHVKVLNSRGHSLALSGGSGILFVGHCAVVPGCTPNAGAQSVTTDRDARRSDDADKYKGVRQ